MWAVCPACRHWFCASHKGSMPLRSCDVCGRVNYKDFVGGSDSLRGTAFSSASFASITGRPSTNRQASLNMGDCESSVKAADYSGGSVPPELLALLPSFFFSLEYLQNLALQSDACCGTGHRQLARCGLALKCPGVPQQGCLKEGSAVVDGGKDIVVRSCPALQPARLSKHKQAPLATASNSDVGQRGWVCF